MQDKDSTKNQLINELIKLRKRIAELEASGTEPYRPEEGLVKDGEKHAILLNIIPDIIYKVDADGYFTYLNDSVRSLGYTPEELSGKHYSEMIRPDEVRSISRPIVLPKYAGKVTGEEGAPKLFDERRTGKKRTRNLEVRLIPKHLEGDKRTVKERIGLVFSYGETSASGHYDRDIHRKDKKFLGTVGIIHDITERKQAEEALKK